jgi:hypothetical protein
MLVGNRQYDDACVRAGGRCLLARWAACLLAGLLAGLAGWLAFGWGLVRGLGPALETEAVALRMEEAWDPYTAGGHMGQPG